MLIGHGSSRRREVTLAMSINMPHPCSRAESERYAVLCTVISMAKWCVF